MRAVPGFSGMPSKLDPTNRTRFDPRGQGRDLLRGRDRSRDAFFDSRANALSGSDILWRTVGSTTGDRGFWRGDSRRKRRVVLSWIRSTSPRPTRHSGNRSASQRRGAW
jgi:hypothetical protein